MELPLKSAYQRFKNGHVLMFIQKNVCFCRKTLNLIQACFENNQTIERTERFSIFHSNMKMFSFLAFERKLIYQSERKLVWAEDACVRALRLDFQVKLQMTCLHHNIRKWWMFQWMHTFSSSAILVFIGNRSFSCCSHKNFPPHRIFRRASYRCNLFRARHNEGRRQFSDCEIALV